MNYPPLLQITFIVACLSAAGLTIPVAGQVVDSVRVEADSIDIAVDSLATPDTSRVAPPHRVPRATVPAFHTVEVPHPSRKLASFPATAIDLELSEQLSTQAGVFVYDLSTPGWPSMPVSRAGTVYGDQVSWNGLPFDELFTGRPAYELLPRGLLDTLAIGSGTRPLPTVIAATRDLEHAEPLTELAYRTSNKGMQYVYASHQQQRVRSVLGDPSRVGLRVGYMGQKADGEFPGSKLERVRGVYGSLSLQRGALGLEITDLTNRRRIGAHGGVITAIPGDPNSIYGRFGALVRNPSAERRTVRNDLTGKASWKVDSSFVKTISLSSNWTRQTFRYTSAPDTLLTKSGRLTSRLDLIMEASGMRLGLHAVTSAEKIRSGSSIPEPERPALNRMSIYGSAGYSRSVKAAATLGVDRSFDILSLNGSLDASYQKGVVGFGVEGSRGIPDTPVITATGFGHLATSQGGTRLGYVSEAAASASLRPATSTLKIVGFVNVVEDGRDWFATSNADSISYLPVGATLITQGATVSLGFRDRSDRGFYVDASMTALAGNETGFIGGSLSPLVARPEWYGSAQSGFRYLLFQQDLDADIGLRVRFWPDFAGRVFHPATGLLAVPLDPATSINTSAVLDFVFEGGIRGATVTLSYENLLAGTELIIGNQLVPGYPLAQRRLRFGVFWPIFN